MKKRVYIKEFKSNAVSLSYQRDNIKELADELGVNVQRINKWRKASRSIIEVSSKASTSKSVVSTEEFKSLKKQLKDKELELEILKKAIHIFSKRDGNIINL